MFIFFFSFNNAILLTLRPIMFIHWVLVIIFKTVYLLIAIAYFTISERKIMASIQRRLGPNIEGGNFGILQPLFDGLKLVLKELIIPTRANFIIYLASPIVILCLSLSAWSVIPFVLNYHFRPNLCFETIFTKKFQGYFISNINFGVFFLLALSSLNVYGIILGGWASNSKYAFIGALRSSAQMISYEVSIGLAILPTVLLTGSFNLTEIVLMQTDTVWFCMPLLPCCIIFFISMLAETNRAPFDLPEAEAELVAGYNVEYGSIYFALFFLGEYCSMLLMAAFFVILFFGGSMFSITLIKIPNFFFSFFFAFKIIFCSFFYILIRAAFPRYRYDQLLGIGWKIFLPIILGFFILVCCLIQTCTIFVVSNFMLGWYLI